MNLHFSYICKKEKKMLTYLEKSCGLLSTLVVAVVILEKMQQISPRRGDKTGY